MGRRDESVAQCGRTAARVDSSGMGAWMDGGPGESGARLGGLVRGWRGMAGLSQRELAARSGLSVTAVRDLEQGRSRRPRAGSLAALARALGLDAEQAAALARAAGQGRGGRGSARFWVVGGGAGAGS